MCYSATRICLGSLAEHPQLLIPEAPSTIVIVPGLPPIVWDPLLQPRSNGKQVNYSDMRPVRSDLRILKPRLIHWAQTQHARITCVAFYHLVVNLPLGPNRGPRNARKDNSSNGCEKQRSHLRDVSSLRMVVFSWGDHQSKIDLTKFDRRAEPTWPGFGHSQEGFMIPQKPNYPTLSHLVRWDSMRRTVCHRCLTRASAARLIMYLYCPCATTLRTEPNKICARRPRPSQADCTFSDSTPPPMPQMIKLSDEPDLKQT